MLTLTYEQIRELGKKQMIEANSYLEAMKHPFFTDEYKESLYIYRKLDDMVLDEKNNIVASRFWRHCTNLHFTFDSIDTVISMVEDVTAAEWNPVAIIRIENRFVEEDDFEWIDSKLNYFKDYPLANYQLSEFELKNTIPISSASGGVEIDF